MIKTKCVYDKKYPEDGAWILVMRKWPRGIPKTKIDEWHKELGPSNELLSDWNKKKISWKQYERRYLKELEGQKELLRKIAMKATKQEMTLLCVEKNDKNCHRRILRNTLVKLAVIEFKKMLKVSPKNIEIYDFYGYFLVYLEKDDEAKRI